MFNTQIQIIMTFMSHTVQVQGSSVVFTGQAAGMDRPDSEVWVCTQLPRELH